MDIEEQIDMKVALAENGFFVTWNEPLLVKSADDAVRSTVRAVVSGLEGLMAGRKSPTDASTEGHADQIEDAGHPEDPEAWRGDQHQPGASPLPDALRPVLAAVGEIEDRLTYRIVRRSVVCSKPTEVLPAIERAEAAFKSLMKLRLDGARLERDD